MYSRNTQPIWSWTYSLTRLICILSNNKSGFLYPLSLRCIVWCSHFPMGCGESGNLDFSGHFCRAFRFLLGTMPRSSWRSKPEGQRFWPPNVPFFFSLVRNWSVSYAKASSITRASGCLLSLRNSKRSGQLVTSTSFSWCSRLCKMIEKAARAAVTTVPTGRQ